MLHKPAGVVTANKDKELPTVMDLLPSDIQSDKLYAVGRLDRDTTGLLLLTDNGPLGFQLLHPQYHVDKTYQVEVNGLLTPDHIQTFQKVIVFLDGTICKPARLEILSASPSLSQVSISISEGKFHQIKKMFLSVGVKVTNLKRIQFGDFTLNPYLAEGNYHPLNQKELQIIKNYLEMSR
ncbi:ribosomal small subunit pseudouridine synthase A [Streptococcus pneumoniae]|nr:ribosomal small subunit pseudouridine synthase A [Streptococcus pneumoniae]